MLHLPGFLRLKQDAGGSLPGTITLLREHKASVASPSFACARRGARTAPRPTSPTRK